MKFVHLFFPALALLISKKGWAHSPYQMGIIFEPSFACERKPSGNYWGCKNYFANYQVEGVTSTDDLFLKAVPPTLTLIYHAGCRSSENINFSFSTSQQTLTLSDWESDAVQTLKIQASASETVDLTFRMQTSPFNTLSQSCQITVDSAYVLPNLTLVKDYAGQEVARYLYLKEIYSDLATAENLNSALNAVENAEFKFQDELDQLRSAKGDVFFPLEVQTKIDGLIQIISQLGEARKLFTQGDFHSTPGSSSNLFQNMTLISLSSQINISEEKILNIRRFLLSEFSRVQAISQAESNSIAEILNQFPNIFLEAES